MRLFFNLMEEKDMQTYLFLIVILILIAINLKLSEELKDLEKKTLDAFRIVCRRLKQNMEDKQKDGIN